MKGALLQRIFARLVGDSILSDNVIEYTAPPSFTDLPNDGLVTKAMLVDVLPPGTISPIVTPIVGNTTANPITVNYGDMEYPTLIFRNADGSNYSGAVNNVDNGTGIVLTGDDNGSGKFVDSFMFVIKP